MNGYMRRARSQGAATARQTRPIALSQVLDACPESMHEAAGPAGIGNWNDLAEVARRHAGLTAIGQEDWAKACARVGRNGAALCMLIVDHASRRGCTPTDRPLRNGRAYFRALVDRAARDELDIAASLRAMARRRSQEAQSARIGRSHWPGAEP